MKAQRLANALVPQNISTATILRSAFPTKSVIFILIVGALLYVVAEVNDDWWEDHIYAGTQGEIWSPLHFYDNKHDLQDACVLDYPDLTIPGRADYILANFDRMAAGWMISERRAKDENMLVTHGCRYASNQPCEDYLALGTSLGLGEMPWNYWSIMDGHAGPYMASVLQRVLIPRVSLALSALPYTSGPLEVESTIKKAFSYLDGEILETGWIGANWCPAATEAGTSATDPVVSGSCALLAAFNPKASTLHVACTGDSRAVLGRWDASSNRYKCIPLSEDQTGFNPKEVARLAESHPDEPDIIDPKTGRLLGLAVTRAFGDHRWKWRDMFVKVVEKKFWGPPPRPESRAPPPYLTAEPEVTDTTIVRVNPHDGDAKAKSDFMIMASDGLWDHISSEDAVECVERWLEAKARGNGSVSKDPELLANPPSFSLALRLEPGVEIKDGEPHWKATPEYFAIEDDNAAVCLARNAMGGTRRNLFLGLMYMSPPRKRRAVDDTTIMVVFFDDFGARVGKEDKAEKQKQGQGHDQAPDKKWWFPKPTIWWFPKPTIWWGKKE